MPPGRTRWPCAASLMAQHPKHLAVLEAVAEQAWAGAQPVPDVGGQKVYRGLAQTHGLRQLCGRLRRGLGQQRTAC